MTLSPFRLAASAALSAALLLWLSACSRPGDAPASGGPAASGHAHEHGSERGPEHASDSAAGGVGASAKSDPNRMCPEHHVPLLECGICRPERIAALKPGESLKVRLSTADSATLAGVEIAAVSTGPMADGPECYAEIAFDQNRLAHIAAPLGGVLQEVHADLGARLKEKEVLAKVWSPSLAEAFAKALLSHQTLERERKLRALRVTSEQALQQAEADHRAACQQLRTMGFTEDEVDLVGTRPHEPVLLEIRAPFAGEVVDRTAVRGALVEPGRPLFTVADRSTMWGMLNLPESLLGGVKLGQQVELRVESFPDRLFTGKLTWIGAEVDERSRMSRARVEIANPDGLLKSRMFAQARILTRVSDSALLVPSSAIHRVEGRTFAFVKVGDDLFEARHVKVGARSQGRSEVLAGLREQESVVANHGFLLKSALLISKLGAGCADD